MPPISAAQVISVLISDAEQRHQAELQAEPVAHQVEYRLLSDGGDPAAHLAEHHDADGREGERPDQRIAEDRSRLGGEYQLADVDEAADRGHDPERQLKRIQGCPRSASAPRRARAGSRAARRQARRAAPGSRAHIGCRAESATWRSFGAAGGAPCAWSGCRSTSAFPAAACSLTSAHSAPSERASPIAGRSACGPFEQAASSRHNSNGRRMVAEPFRQAKRSLPLLVRDALAFGRQSAKGDRKAQLLSRRDAVLPIMASGARKKIGGARLQMEAGAIEPGIGPPAKAQRRRRAERNADDLIEHVAVTVPADPGARVIAGEQNVDEVARLERLRRPRRFPAPAAATPESALPA